jgi:iron(III) transport system ATP-binding protein
MWITEWMCMTAVRLSNISKRFDGGELGAPALDGISLDIAAGELFFLLGPSGCGKSTLLRLVAGLLAPSEGQIFFNDRDVTTLPTRQRNAVMCFQSYALWPHMTVRQNVRFGLGIRGLDAIEQDRRSADALEMVRMTHLADRKPGQLSGGQQQRVALARALAVRPDCLLLDEPLSNLDAKLRLEMRGEIRRICKSAGCTTIYVTHDQKEALSIADRMAVLKDGRMVQCGTPSELYHRPRSSFIADFLGQMNLISGRIVARYEKTVRVQTSFGLVAATAGDEALPEAVIIGIRPERVRIWRHGGGGENRVTGKIFDTIFLGESSEITVEVPGQRLKMITTDSSAASSGEITIEFDANDALALAS